MAVKPRAHARAREHADPREIKWSLQIGLYSIWIRESDGMPREVMAIAFYGGRRGKHAETVMTITPRPDSYDWGSRDGERRETPAADFLATHFKIASEFEDHYRPPKQLNLIDEARELERWLRRRRRLTPKLEWELQAIGPAFHGNRPWRAAPA